MKISMNLHIVFIVSSKRVKKIQVYWRWLWSTRMKRLQFLVASALYNLLSSRAQPLGKSQICDTYKMKISKTTIIFGCQRALIYNAGISDDRDRYGDNGIDWTVCWWSYWTWIWFSLIITYLFICRKIIFNRSLLVGLHSKLPNHFYL